MKEQKSKNKQDIFTDSNIPIKRVYHNPKLKHDEPGKYPFTRGIHENMYRERLWTMRQYSGFGDAVHTNKRFKFMLENG